MAGGIHASDPAVLLALAYSRERVPIGRAHVRARFLRCCIRHGQCGHEAKLPRPLWHSGCIGDPDLSQWRLFDGGIVPGSQDFPGSDEHPLRWGAASLAVLVMTGVAAL